MTPEVRIEWWDDNVLHDDDVTPYTLDGVSIVYGRTDITEQICTATTCTFDLLGYTAGWLQIGNAVTVSLDGSVRFEGQITDCQLSENSAQVIAVSTVLSQLGRDTLDGAPGLDLVSWPLAGQLDWVVTNILGLAANAGFWAPPILSVISTNTTLVSIDFAEFGGKTPLEILQLVLAGDGSVVLYETFDPPMIVLSQYRSSIAYDMKVIADDMGWGWQMSRHVADRVNTCYVAGAFNDAYYAYDLDVQRFGIRSREITTPLQLDTDLEFRAIRTVGQSIAPRWALESLQLPLHHMSPTQQAYAMALTIGSVVEIDALVSGAQTRWFVEGWTERIGQVTHTLDLRLSDVDLTRVWEKWSDVTPTRDWDHVIMTQRWIDLFSAWI